MTAQRERILVVENDPDASDLIARQALRPLGYQVKVVDLASEAIQQAVLFAPDLVITSLDLPDLSGKDLLVALSSQGLDLPVVMMADKGQESDVIQAFRLGASDYLSRPVREAELVSAVERSLKQIRARRERENLAQKLQETNRELQRRVRELTTIFAIGKAVTSITDHSTLFSRIVEGAVYVTEADRGWFLVRDEGDQHFVLRAYRNLPKPLEAKLNQPWDDGISSLVALSGEALSIHGEPLKRFKIARLGQAALVVPVKIQEEKIGLLVVVRKAPQPFTTSDQTMLEAVADYASISLVNTRLFRALEGRAQSLQRAMERARQNERTKDARLQNLAETLRRPLKAVQGYVDMLSEGHYGKTTTEQRKALGQLEDQLKRIEEVLEQTEVSQSDAEAGHLVPTNLNDLIRKAIDRFLRIAQRAGLALLAELPAEPVTAMVDHARIHQVFDGLITNAIKFSPPGGQISVRVARAADQSIQITVQDAGVGLPRDQLEEIFESGAERREQVPNPIDVEGLSLSEVKAIVEAHGGKIWAERMDRQGSAVHFTLSAHSEGD